MLYQQMCSQQNILYILFCCSDYVSLCMFVDYNDVLFHCTGDKVSALEMPNCKLVIK